MIKTIVAAVALMISSQAFAGGSVAWKNEALDFTIIASKSTDYLEVCNDEDSCIRLNPIREDDDGGKTIYKADQCLMSMETIFADHAEGNTKNEGMLSLTYQVVQVIEGKCELKQTKYTNKMRSITGIYL